MSASEPVIAIFFGSQGSVALNKVIADSLPIFEKNGAQLLHAVGKSNQLPKAAPNYKPVSYIEDMASSSTACKNDLHDVRNLRRSIAFWSSLETSGSRSALPNM